MATEHTTSAQRTLLLRRELSSAVSQLQRVEASVCELAQQIVKARVGAAVPTQTNFGKDPEWGTLAREINKKARHMPLRQLFGRIPNVMAQLAPCVMMSPLSIAQYLPADAKPFVIFDEASQIPSGTRSVPSRAVRRSSSSVIPNNFPRPASASEASTTRTTTVRRCRASRASSMNVSPRTSRVCGFPGTIAAATSLIAFSNAKYYRGELMTFPSPVTRDTAVRYVHVEGGIYEHGGAKVNREEAEAVVAEVVRRMRTSTQSIGVVTFNGDQQRLIENMLDQARRSDPALEPHFDRNQTREPVLVKNIENVQGDERDIIIFSEERGWEIHPQVGVSFFRIDLGVVHPDFPGRYLAGVECDGATYHRSATARDRDRLRELPRRSTPG